MGSVRRRARGPRIRARLEPSQQCDRARRFEIRSSWTWTSLFRATDIVQGGPTVKWLQVPAGYAAVDRRTDAAARAKTMISLSLQEFTLTGERAGAWDSRPHPAATRLRVGPSQIYRHRT